MSPVRPIHVVDTNVLFNWLGHHCSLTPPPWATRPGARRRFEDKLAAAARFCEDPGHEIVIPHMALIELYGVFLQKSYDLDDYEGWHRRRRAALNTLEYHLMDPAGRVRCDDRPMDVELALNLCRVPIPDPLLARQRRNGRDDFVPKALDGLDAGVLAAAWGTAEEATARRVVLVTDDSGLRNFVRHYAGTPNAMVAGRRFPSNLRSARA